MLTNSQQGGIVIIVDREPTKKFKLTETFGQLKALMKLISDAELDNEYDAWCESQELNKERTEVWLVENN